MKKMTVRLKCINYVAMLTCLLFAFSAVNVVADSKKTAAEKADPKKPGKVAPKKPASKSVAKDKKPQPKKKPAPAQSKAKPNTKSKSKTKPQTKSKTKPKPEAKPLPPIPTVFDPVLKYVLPRGAQRGHEVTITFKGDRLHRPKRVIFHTHKSIPAGQPHPAFFELQQLEATRPERNSKGAPQNSQEVKARIRIHPQTPLGEHTLRLQTEGGITDAFAFYVSPYPTIHTDISKTKNTTIENAKRIDLKSPVTIEAQLNRSDKHHYQFELKKDESIGIEVEGQRLATALFDPVITISDENGKRVSMADDTKVLGQDPSLTFKAPAQGRYYLAIHDSVYLGSATTYYRMHIGRFLSTPDYWRSKPLNIAYKASNELTLQTNKWSKQHVLVQRKTPSPSALPVLPESLAFKGMDSISEAAKHDGIKWQDSVIYLAGDLMQNKKNYSQVFPITLPKGEYEFKILAQEIGTELDSLLNLWTLEGKKPKSVKNNNDSNGSQDSQIIYTVKKEEKFALVIHDFFMTRLSQDLRSKEDRDLRYLLRISKRDPKATFKLPEYQQYKQIGNRLVIPRGGRTTLWLNVAQVKITEPITAKLAFMKNNKEAPAPKGLHLEAPLIPKGTTKIPVTLIADKDAEMAGGLLRIVPVTKDGKVLGDFTHPLGLIYGQPNNHPYHMTALKDVAYCVTPTAPFSIRIDELKAPLVNDGEKYVRVHVKRDPDFKAPVTVEFLNPPSGVGASGIKTVAANKNYYDYRITANGSAKAQTVPLQFKARATIGGKPIAGALDIASNSQTLKIQKPHFDLKLDNTTIALNEEAELTGTLTFKKDVQDSDKVSSPITLTLRNLPHGLSAENSTITVSKDQTKFSFKIKATQKVRLGGSRSHFIQIAYHINKEKVRRNTGRGATLRVIKQRQLTSK